MTSPLISAATSAGADLDAVTAKNWTPLSYAKAKGKYGATEEKGIYPEVRCKDMRMAAKVSFTQIRCFIAAVVCVQDVLKYYKATLYGSGPPALGCRSPRESYDPHAEGFMRERGSYQDPMEHP